MNKLSQHLNTFKRTLVISLVVFSFLPGLAFAAGISVNYPGYPGPIFSENNLAPGAKIEKTISVTNNEATTQRFAFKVNSGPKGELKNHIYLSIKSGVLTLTGPKKITDYYGFSNETELDNVAPGETKQYTFIAELDREIGNEYQNKSENFDLLIGFVANEIEEENEDETLEEIITPIVTTLAGILASPENTPEVAGDVDTGTEQTQDIRGEDVTDTSGVVACPWWWIVLAILAVSLLIYYAWEIRHEQRKFWWFIPVFLTLIAIITHLYFHRYFEETPYCDWVWLFATLILAIESGGYLALRKRQTEN